MLDELKTEVCQANLALRDAGLVILTWGNASARDPSGEHIVIKPSGVSYDEMRAEHMVVLNLSGEVVEGGFRPSSDTATHLELYRAWPEVFGIVHTHSTHATAWAQARRSLPCYGTTHADNFRGAVPLTDALAPEEIAGDYEAATGRIIVRAFAGRSPMEVPAALVGGHGPFTWGRSAAQAVENSIVLEQSARMAMLTERVRSDAPELDTALLERHFQRKHGPGAYYGQDRR
jgi:L-ribulose-5-phosphate 4-epimerase